MDCPDEAVCQPSGADRRRSFGFYKWKEEIFDNGELFHRVYQYAESYVRSKTASDGTDKSHLREAVGRVKRLGDGRWDR